MKKYIGTKEVSATPAWRIDGKVYPKDGPVPRSMNREDGYRIVYKDGYKSWSPKEAFEKAYKVADTFLDRLNVEDTDLAEKYEKCHAFVESDKFRDTIKEDYPAFLLYLQREAMGSYLGTLHNRIEYANGVKTKPDTKYNFGEAIQALKFGLAICRSGWNDKNLMVFKQVSAHIEGDVISKMQSLPQSAKDLIGNEKSCIDYKDQCLLYNRKTGEATSWCPSTTDLFAEDWRIVFE